MKLSFLLRPLVLVTISVLAACAWNNWNALQAQYSQCVDPYNTKFRDLPAERVMMVGTNTRTQTTQCFWAWGYSSHLEAYQATAASCKAEGYISCREWANTNGIAPWAQEISDNGGRAPSSSADSGMDAGTAYAIGAALGSGIGAALSGSSGGSGGGGYSGGSSYSAPQADPYSGGSYSGGSGTYGTYSGSSGSSYGGDSRCGRINSMPGNVMC